MMEHECEFFRTGELRPLADADYVVTECILCSSEMLFEASAEDYLAELAVSA